MPNVRAYNPSPNVRSANQSLNIRVSSFQTGKTGDVTPAGTPIGLLLVLTYAEKASAIGSYSDFRPSIRITSQ